MTGATRPIQTRYASCLIALLVFGVTGVSVAQEVDASKPTNFYPLLDNSLEYNARETGGNLMGYRAQLIYPPSDKHLFLFEVPLLYNDGTEKFGIGDLRGRYFFLPYKNYDKFFGAFGPSLDVFAPTGSSAKPSENWPMQSKRRTGRHSARTLPPSTRARPACEDDGQLARCTHSSLKRSGPPRRHTTLA